MLAKRNLIGVVRNPEALLDVTLQPMIFLALFTYIFGGAIADGSQHDYLQFLLPGVLAQTIAFGCVAIGVNLNSDIEKGVFDRFRIAADRARRAAGRRVLGDVVRYTLLCVVTLGFGYSWLPRETSPRGARRLPARDRFALCLCWASVFVGMIARTPGAVQGIICCHVPADLRVELFARRTRCRAGCSVIDVNPLTHLVGALRALMHGGPAGNVRALDARSMGALLAVFVPLALRAYGRRA